MKKLKRIFALLLAVTLVSTTQGTHALAQENAAQTALEETETLSQSEGAEKGTEQEETVQEVTEEQSESESVVDVEESESEEIETKSIQQQESETTATSQADPYILPEIGFVYAETMELDVPGTQNIALVFNEEVNVDSPKVRYRIGDSKKVYSIDLAEQVENVLLFTEDYTTDSPTGIYRIIGFSYEVGGQYYELDFETETTYSVGEEGVITENENLVDITDADSLEDIESSGSLVEASIIDVEDGLSASDISSALANAQTIAKDEGVTLKSALNIRSFSAASNSNIVVVLAPSHCAKHNGGAVRGNLSETTLVLAIAKYAKAELETYSGVTVYLSQTTESCTWGTDLSTCLSGHADYAKSVGADVLISLHVNSTETTTTTATGAEAIITIHSSYYNSMYNLSSSILAQLAKVGLATRSIYTNADDKDRGKYSTGQWVDDFSVIRNSVLQGIPAFILEHAFINNASDQKLLTTESGLKSIGVADATGIANYYGLSKKTAVQRAQVEAFVTRLYAKILGRNPDSGGLKAWTDALVTKQQTAAQVVMRFLNSAEFTSHNVNNDTYVEILYNALLDRASDASGKTAWLDLLNIGMSRYYVASRFINSNEFTALCKTYGVDKGTITSTEPRDQNVNYTRFVSRLYTKVLNRPYDVAGLNAWTTALISKQQTAAQIVMSFLNSREFTNRNVDNSTYVEILYNALLNRASDASGKTAWVDLLNIGMSRYYVAGRFINSSEFTAICKTYDINRGTITSTEPRDQNVGYTRLVSGLYTKVLNRSYDVSGLNAWTGALINGTYTYEQVAEKFICSREFELKKLSNSEYVKILYRTFLNREPNATELAQWVAVLNNGGSRLNVLYNFSETASGIVSVNGRNMHSQYYTDSQVDDRTLLAALISTEAGGESYAGQVAVGVVVMNRMEHSWYPNSLKDNVYLEKQFQVARVTVPAVVSPLTTVLQNTSKISANSWKAADLALSMLNCTKTVPGITLSVGKSQFDYIFFMTPAAYQNSKKDGDETFVIGNHVFFNRK